MSVAADRLEAIAFELRYWRELLDDLKGAHDEVEPIAAGIADAAVALISLVSLVDPRANAFVMDGLEATNRAMRAIATVQERLGAIADLAQGRQAALAVAIAETRTEAGL